MNSGTIPLVSENQEKSLEHMFLTFFEVCEINTKNKPLGSEPPGSLSMGSLLLICSTVNLFRREKRLFSI